MNRADSLRGVPLAVLLACLLLACLLPGEAAAAACRVHSTTPTRFAAGSLIIPMDNGRNSGNSVITAYGLVWHLLNHGIRVAWIMDVNKTAGNQKDFTVSGAAPVVESLVRAGPHDTFANVGASPQHYSGAPFVIPAAQADAALRLIRNGVLPQNPAVRFGWSLTNFYNGVVVHRSTVQFSAPVLRITAEPPRPLALFADTAGAAKSWMDEHLLAKAGLNLAGVIYDALSNTDIAGGALARGGYQMFWANGDALNKLSSAAHDRIAEYQAAGGGVAASGNAVLELECFGCSKSQCNGTCAPPTQFQGLTGVVDPKKGHGSHQGPVSFGDPYTQIDDWKYHGLADELKAYQPRTGWRPCVRPLSYNGQGNVLISVLDEAGRGPVFYIGGRNYNPGNAEASHMLAMQRTVLSWLFQGGDTVQQEHPRSAERSRSMPIVVEESGALLSTQGVFVWPPSTQELFFNPASPASWSYPAVGGHLRIYDLTNAAPEQSGFAAIDGASAVIPAAADRNLYTAQGSQTLTRIAFAATQAATLQAALGAGTASEATALIDRVRQGGLGGIDRATPAWIDAGTSVTFPSYQRPTVVYAAGLDGMLHAFPVRAGSFSDELWGFIPPDQLGRLQTNDAAIQASPAVADIYGDLLDSNGNPGADGKREQVTLLVLTTGESGRAVYGIDVSNPDPAATECPGGLLACVKGPNPLWVSSPSGMGSARGAAIASASPQGQVKPYVFVATDDPAASSGQGGAVLFALDATDGSEVWRRSLPYTRTIPVQGVEPNEVPGTPALVDKSGSAGYQTHLYFGDLEGKLWEVTTGDGSATVVWDAAQQFGGAAEARYPIASSVALYRDTAGNLHAVLVTGGVYWAPSNATIRQQLVDVNISTGAANVLRTFAAGERVFASPVVSNRDAYLISSTGLVDVISGWSSGGASGTFYRAQVADPAHPVVSAVGLGEMSGSSVGVSGTGQVVATTTRTTGVVDNSGADTTSTLPDRQEASQGSSQLRLWLPGLRR